MAMPLATRRFTVDEYHRMAEAGILTEDDRVELLDGEIVVMSPIGSRHAGTVARIESLFHKAVGDRAIVWVQNPIRPSQFSEPQPDLCLLKPRDDFYTGQHPEPADVLLIVEVADASLGHDRDRKIPLYACAGIPESWLVNLPDAVIEVHSDPGPHGYRAVRRAARGETLEPSVLPGVEIAADGILG